MIVREDISFERGKDPRKSMKVGKEVEREIIKNAYKEMAGADLDDMFKDSWDFHKDKVGGYTAYVIEVTSFNNKAYLSLIPGVTINNQFYARPETSLEFLEERLKRLSESISFERGKDPRETMEIGLDAQMEKKYGNLWKVFKRCNDLSHISENFEWVSEIQFNEEDPYFNIESYFYYTDDDGSKYSIQFVAILREGYIFVKDIVANQSDDIRTVRQFIEFTEAFYEDDDWQGLFESVNFERGKDPRDQMEIGINKQFQDAIEEMLLRDAGDLFAINSIAFPKYSDTIDFVMDEWADEDTLEKTLPYLMELDSLNDSFHIFDFIDGDSFTGGGYKNGVYKFVAKIDPNLVRGLKGKMLLAQDPDVIKIMDL